MDKGLINFIKTEGGIAKIGIILALALALIIISRVTDWGEQNDESLEDRVAEMCSMTDGVGDCQVMITYTKDSEVYAVLVICDGAESVVVREKITSMICSLFGVGANRVEILKIKS